MATKAATEDHSHHAHSAHNQIKHFDNLRNILKNARHSSGLDLYQHLVDVMNHIVSHCPESGIDKFEEISYLLKLQRDGKIKSLSEFLKISDDRAYSKPAKLESGAEKYLQKA
jgi:Radial spokehead-like protein